MDNTATTPKNPARDQPGGHDREALKRELIQFGKMVAFVLLVVFLCRALIVEGSRVTGPSMLPTLAEDDRILVFKAPMLLQRLPGFGPWDAIMPGDLVVFDTDEALPRRFVKRVIAVGPSLPRGGVVSAHDGDAGDDARFAVRVRYEDGAVYVNNRRLEEDYLGADPRPSRERLEAAVGDGQYFVLGDHRGMSMDSRQFGVIDRGQVVGKAFLRYWPPSKFGVL